MIEQMAEHHQVQLSEVMDDMRYAKQSVILAQKQDEYSAARSIVREIEGFEEEKRVIVDELCLVRKEIKDLDEENAILKRELAKLNSTLRSLKN
jgi:septal ring factor EnvC (AmiA/AmiB activator)